MYIVSKHIDVGQGIRRVSQFVEKFLSGAQAAEFLGVKPATLYAYASRGLIESMPSESGRERTYRLSDLVKLRQSSRGFKSPREAEQPSWTGPVIKSSITEIGEQGHSYRGENALGLAKKNTAFEAVAELLWETDEARSEWETYETSGELLWETDETGVEQWRSVKPFSLRKHLRTAALSDMDHLELLKLLLVTAEMADPVARKLSASDISTTARRLVITMASTVGLLEERDQYVGDAPMPIAHTLLWGLAGKRSHEQAKLINMALVLCADHELNASALAARVAASCDSSLYSCLLSALGTFSGTLHGSASRRAEDMVAHSLKFKSANAWLKDCLREFASPPGFGTELYRQGDPRAKLLLEAATKVGGKNAQLKRLTELVACVRENTGLQPNLDIGLAAVTYALQLPHGAGAAIFAISRTAGWIAHAREQNLYGGGVIRPRARYIGK